MAMPRPSGEAQKIAEETIPGLNSNQRDSARKKSDTVSSDDVETKIVKINEKNRGKLGSNRKKAS